MDTKISFRLCVYMCKCEENLRFMNIPIPNSIQFMFSKLQLHLTVNFWFFHVHGFISSAITLRDGQIVMCSACFRLIKFVMGNADLDSKFILKCILCVGLHALFCYHQFLIFFLFVFFFHFLHHLFIIFFKN